MTQVVRKHLTDAAALPGPLVRYDAMVSAIAACHSVDEITDIHDKALALELYAKQAMNVEAEREATEIRLRAERRAGEMLAELKRATPQTARRSAATIAGDSEYRVSLDRAGINERTGQRWQELAAVPAATFEQHLNAVAKPTTNGILRAVNGATRMDDQSLWVWGRLRDFERDKYVERTPADIYGGMTETMQADVRRILPSMLDWLNELQEGAQ